MLSIKSPKKSLVWVVLGLIIAILAVGLFWWLSHPLEKSATKESVASQKQAPSPVSLSAKVLFTGNSFWGRYTNDAAKKSAEPYKFPFARLHEFNRENYDAWVTGLECPTTEKGIAMTSAEMEANLSFNCDPNYLGEFAKWFGVVGLANNHTDNRGEDGFEETKQALDKHNIQYFGHYDPEVLSDVCEVIKLPVKVKYSDQSEQKGSLPVAMCGYHFVFKLPSAESIAEITKYAEIMPVIAFPHGGAEYKPAPDEIKINTIRSMIDAGADMVIGDHPHWVQNTEVYKGKLIVYSMGNFMFDQQFNAEVTRSAAIDVEMSSSQTDAVQLAKWLELGDSCKIHNDDCFEQAGRAGLGRISLNYQFNAIATSNKGYQTYPAPDLQSGVEQRLRWQESMEALGQ